MNASGLRANIEIGRVRVAMKSDDSDFMRLLDERYGGYLAGPGDADVEFDVELAPEPVGDPDEDVSVLLEGDVWRLQRGDFRAEWDMRACRGRIRQPASPYATDAVLRILHSLLLAREGGFLVHAASAVRGGRAFLFAGKSGAGKTTISRLAPDDVRVLTDEISYLRKEGGGYIAYGTPFAGELARVGENIRAPLHAIYLLAHGDRNCIEPVAASEAARAMLGNVLFFAKEPALVQSVFRSTLALVESVPVLRLTFVPDSGVWELIR
jgi:hypothetical protein